MAGSQKQKKNLRPGELICNGWVPETKEESASWGTYLQWLGPRNRRKICVLGNLFAMAGSQKQKKNLRPGELICNGWVPETEENLRPGELTCNGWVPVTEEELLKKNLHLQRHFGKRILSPSSDGTYSDDPNRQT
jgi:hypothetical protein